jgi:molecular chaperone DnaJ
LFKEATTAYEVLNDPLKRKQYDMTGSNQRGARPPFTSPFNDFFNSVFEFGGSRPKFGKTITVTLPITLEEVFKGCEKEIVYSKRVICPTCNGVGGDFNACTQCNGTGKRVHRGANLAVQVTCEYCRGEGQTLLNKCLDCHGEGFSANPENKNVKFEVFAGIEHGMRYVYRGLGEPMVDGNPGDLVLVIEVMKHDFFERQNADLYCKIPVTYAQLVLGDQVDVRSIDGEDVKLSIPAGTQPNQKLKMKAKGLPKFNNGADTYRGDQYVELKLQVPKELSEEHRELIQKIAEIEKQGSK